MIIDPGKRTLEKLGALVIDALLERGWTITIKMGQPKTAEYQYSDGSSGCSIACGRVEIHLNEPESDVT